MALTLASFGNPRLLDENSTSLAFPEKGLLAAGYIASRPGRTVARAELAAFLWGEDASNPLANLRQLLARVKARQEEIGTTILKASETDVVVPATAIDCDFQLLLELPADHSLKIVEMSLACVTGGFFAGIGIASDKAELWLAAQQEQVLTRFTAALEALAHDDDTPARRQVQKQAALRLLEFDPYNEVAYRTLINAYSAERNIAQAKAMFERYRARLHDDLGAAPDSSMLAIHDQVARQAMMRLPAIPVAANPSRTSVQVKGHLPRLMLMPPPLDARLITTSLLEDVTISLCRARSVLLVAPHTARRIAAMDDGARQEAYLAWDVSYVLETSFAPASGAEVLFASLIDVLGDTIIWAEHLPVDPANLGAAYHVMIRRIAAAAIARIEQHEFSRIGRTTTPTAYQNFLIGKRHERIMDLPEVRRARRAFRATLREMPDFAPALGGLSRTEHREWLLTARGDTELLRLAEEHAQAAIVADAHDSTGFHQLGVTRLYRGAVDESLELFEIAERNAPSHSDLIADHADTLVHASRPEEALAKIDLAFELNPLGPDHYWWTAAGANYSLKRYETAIENLGHVVDQTNTLRINAACWAMLGDKRKARAYMRQTMENFPDFEIDKWLAMIPFRDPAQSEHYREGLRRAGFK